MSQTSVYGYPCVENPNDFTPDKECSSPEEIETHRLACLQYKTADYKSNRGCFFEHSDDGKSVKHVTRTSWGIGINTIIICDGCGELPVIHCHECHQDFCEICWVEHESKGLDSERCPNE